MAERKIINKYYPPDFDASKTIRTRKPERKGPKQQTIRLMTPFSMRCNGCGEYIYKGKKFNARKEVTSEKYLGISIIRFYIRCPRCSTEITFKTDPKNSDYSAGKGAQRNYEPWRGDQKEEETQEDRLDRLMKEQEQEQPDEPNAMERLESKVIDSKREIATADALDELRMRNARIDRVDPLSVLNSFHDNEDGKLRESKEPRLDLEEQEDELEARAAFESADGSSVRRVNDSQPSLPSLNSSLSSNMFAPEAMMKKRKNTKSNLLGVTVAPKKKRLI